VSLREPSRLIKQLIEQISTKGIATTDVLYEQWKLSVDKDISFRNQLLKTKTLEDFDFQAAMGAIVHMDVLDRLIPAPNECIKIFTQTIPIKFAKKYLFYPARFKESELVFAVMCPWPSTPYEEAANALGRKCSFVLSTEQEILNAINHGYDRNTGSAEEAAEILEDDEELNALNEFTNEDTEDLLDVEDEEPIKRLMNSILFQSVKADSSDIHIDPGANETVVRNRIDGILHKVTQVPKPAHVPLLNRVKVMSGLDISVKNQPQDGRTMILLAGKKVDIRVSIIPTVHGEQAVLRLLNQSSGIIALERLGMNDKMSSQIKSLINQPHGILLVTGPTGSGKTTTLYSALNLLDASTKNIVTIEDPVEYRISNYGQMQVNEKIGVTFAKGLRSMLRQDPDVIMVGEIRDAETAQIAIQASLTGHLVLSTLHTNDAASSVVRLIDMGIEPFLVATTVSAVLAQRLVRKICPHCKESYPVTLEELKNFDIPTDLMSDFKGILWRGKGCSKCKRTGYMGRVGVYELLVIDDVIRQAVIKSVDGPTLKRIAEKTGMRGLRQDCIEKVAQGVTSIDEMLRVVFTQTGYE
jgi:general secretion pathway protein E